MTIPVLFPFCSNKLSDCDIDAALALQDTLIDAIEHPFITRWLDLVSDYISKCRRTKVAVAMSLSNLNLSSSSFNNSIAGDMSMHNESVCLKHLASPNKLIAS